MVDTVSAAPCATCMMKEVNLLSIILSSLRALVAKREWNEIEDIGRAKKSPIGWEVSYRACGCPSILA